MTPTIAMGASECIEILMAGFYSICMILGIAPPSTKSAGGMNTKTLCIYIYIHTYICKCTHIYIYTHIFFVHMGVT